MYNLLLHLHRHIMEALLLNGIFYININNIIHVPFSLRAVEKIGVRLKLFDILKYLAIPYDAFMQLTPEYCNQV